MADVYYKVCQAKTEITNTKDNCQGADSPRYTPEFGATCRTDVITYAEGGCPEKWSWGPSLTNEFEVIEDDLVKKY